MTKSRETQDPAETIALSAQKAAEIVKLMEKGVDEMDAMRRRFADRRVGLHGGDNLLAAIPRELRAQVRAAEIADEMWRRGEKATVGDREVGRGFCVGDPVKKTAIGLGSSCT